MQQSSSFFGKIRLNSFALAENHDTTLWNVFKPHQDPTLISLSLAPSGTIYRSPLEVFQTLANNSTPQAIQELSQNMEDRYLSVVTRRSAAPDPCPNAETSGLDTYLPHGFLMVFSYFTASPSGLRTPFERHSIAVRTPFVLRDWHPSPNPTSTNAVHSLSSLRLCPGFVALERHSSRPGFASPNAIRSGIRFSVRPPQVGLGHAVALAEVKGKERTQVKIEPVGMTEQAEMLTVASLLPHKIESVMVQTWLDAPAEYKFHNVGASSVSIGGDYTNDNFGGEELETRRDIISLRRGRSLKSELSFAFVNDFANLSVGDNTSANPQVKEELDDDPAASLRAPPPANPSKRKAAPGGNTGASGKRRAATAPVKVSKRKAETDDNEDAPPAKRAKEEPLEWKQLGTSGIQIADIAYKADMIKKSPFAVVGSRVDIYFVITLLGKRETDYIRAWVPSNDKTAPNPPHIRFTIGNTTVLPAISDALVGARAGIQRQIIIPAEHAFGEVGLPASVPFATQKVTVSARTANDSIVLKAPSRVAKIAVVERGPDDLQVRLRAYLLGLQSTSVSSKGLVLLTCMKSRTAPKYYLCNCSECFQCISVCPGTQSVVKGRYLAGREYRKHVKQQNLIGVQIQPDLPQPDSFNSLNDNLPDPIEEFQRSIKERSSPSQSNRRQRRASSKPFDKPSDNFYAKLNAIQLRLNDYSRSALQGQLVFCIPPSTLPPSEMMENQLRLNESDEQNQTILNFERWINLTRNHVLNGPQNTVQIRIKKTVVLKELEQATSDLVGFKLSQWRQQRKSTKDKHRYKEIDTSNILSKNYSSWPPGVLLTYLLVVSLYILSHVLLKSASDVLPCIRGVLNLSSDEIHEDIPPIIDARTVLKRLSLAEPPHKAIACCPQCWAAYPFEPGKIGTLPLQCTARETSGSAECGTPIRKQTAQERDRVEKEFLYHDFKQWLAWMFCREDIADELEWDPLSDEERRAGVLNDIWDGSILRDLQGPGDADDRFVVKLPGERRLVFSFNYDSLNPYGNRASGKSVKITGMYLACLSLRRHIHFLVENVLLVGVIPGPDAPATSQVNHIIRLLVDDFLDLWYHGVYFTRTLRHTSGLRVRCAIVPIVCDLPTARQLSGNASATSEQQCNECDLPLSEVDNIDYRTWPIRSKKEHMRLASDWKNCATVKEQNAHWSQHHVRWSEFLRLPYWDPTKHVVIDSMHGFYLGLFNRHCCIVWGMDASKADSGGTNDEPSHIPKPLMDASRFLLRHGTKPSLQILGLDVLRQLCKDAGLRYSSRFTKKQLLDSLGVYRISKSWFDAEDNYLGDDGQASQPPDTVAKEAQIVFESATKSYISNQLRLPLARAICRLYLQLPNVDGLDLKSLKARIREERYQ
ncbi:hypothetical protein ONZ45_g7565 [Pleurotus djamor]|nr:hypothetical protein ONZ45_g7565 [Pleurotus djamor]